jgi:plasmid stability protein
MASLTIRNLPPEVYARLRELARRHRRSVTQEAAFIIEEAVGRAEDPAEIWRQIDKVREVIRQRYGAFADSTPLVREDRQR